MLPDTRFGSRTRRLAFAIDLSIAALVLLTIGIEFSGGLRLSIAGLRISAHSPGRMLAALLVLAVVRFLVVARASVFGVPTDRWRALWLHERLGASRVLGLFIGLAGVTGLAWSKAGFTANEHGISTALAIAACLAATASYGYGGNFTKKHLSGVPSLALATGSQLSAAIVLALPAWSMRPAAMPSGIAWLSLALLAVLCTGVAYILYFRLIARTGPTNAATVTFLIPAFAALFGWWFLDETITAAMWIGGVVILAGTALAMGLVPRATTH